MISGEKCIPLLQILLAWPLQREIVVAQSFLVGASGARHAGCSYSEPSTEFVIYIELLRHIVYGLAVMLLCAQRYFLQNRFSCLPNT